MKQKDILLIVVIVIITGAISLVVSNYIFANPKDRKTKVEVVEKITSEFITPDSKYINANSINPTKTIRIGDNSNPTPFGTQR